MKKSRSKEEGNAMPSVRSRIKQFESLTSEENKANEEPSNNNNNKVKRECNSVSVHLQLSPY